jgi:hypothetical protein
MAAFLIHRIFDARFFIESEVGERATAAITAAVQKYRCSMNEYAAP